MEKNKILVGDNIETLKTLPDNSIDCCITSPPYYGLRDYGTGKWIGGDPNCPHYRTSHFSTHTSTGHKGMYDYGAQGAVSDGIYKTVCPKCGAIREDKQVGLEETPEEYIDRLVSIFREVKRALKDDGTLWVNIGDSYNSSGHSRNEDGSITFSEKAQKQSTNKGSYDGQFNKKVVSSCKPKDLIGVPWMLAFALRADGWYLRSDIIWQKPNPMPESVRDRCTKSHEYIFMFSKNPNYYFDYEAIQEPCNIQNPSNHIKFGGEKYPDNVENRIYSGNEYKPRTKNCQYDGQKPNSMHVNRENGGKDKQYLVRNKRDVWTINPSTFKGAHFATFPEELVANCLLAGCPKDGIVLDPFFGSGTVGVVAKKHHRNYIGCELNEEYVKMAEKRLKSTRKSLF